MSKRRIIWGLASLSLLLVLSGIGFTVWKFTANKPPISVEKSVRSQLDYPIYLPTKLPGNFKINPSSLSVAEQKVLVFKAEDGTDSSIVFTEQKRPKDLNFTEFYHQSISEGKIVDNTPHSTYMGKTFDAKTNIMSIVTPETWILITTPTPVTQEQVVTLVKSLYRYKPQTR